MKQPLRAGGHAETTSKEHYLLLDILLAAGIQMYTPSNMMIRIRRPRVRQEFNMFGAIVELGVIENREPCLLGRKI